MSPPNEAISILGWEEVPLQLPEPVFEPASWILLSFDQNDLQRLQQALHQQGKTTYQALCLRADTPAVFTRTGEYDFCINPGNADHYRWLMAGISNGEPVGVLLSAGNAPEDEPAGCIQQFLSGFRFLLQAIKQRGKTKIWVSTTGAYRVHAAEQSRPQQRALAVLAAGALEENPELRGALVDQGKHPDAADTTILTSVLGVAAPTPLVIRGKQQFLPV